MSEEIQEEVAFKGPGVMLKERRESLRLSIEEIADKLHLRPAVVADLEQDIIDHSVSTTFTKGYVRLYAKHMDMDPTPLLQAFDELANPIKQPAKLQSFSQKMAKQASDKRLMMLSYFILFSIVAMAVVWWFQQPEETATVTTSTVQSQPLETPSVESESVESKSPAVSSLNDAQYSPPASDTDVSTVEEQDIDARPGGTFPATTTEDSEQGSLDPITTTTESVAIEEPLETVADDTDLIPTEAFIEESTVTTEALDDNSPTISETAFETNENTDTGELLRNDVEGSFTDPEPAGNNDILDDTLSELNAAELSVADEAITESVTGTEPVTQALVFTFAEDCWMNLTDATGENIAYGIKTAGRVMPVSGIPPFEVVIAQPQVVQLTVDGVPFDLSGFPAGRTARFVIGE